MWAPLRKLFASPGVFLENNSRTEWWEPSYHLATSSLQVAQFVG